MIAFLQSCIIKSTPTDGYFIKLTHDPEFKTQPGIKLVTDALLQLEEITQDSYENFGKPGTARSCGLVRLYYGGFCFMAICRMNGKLSCSRFSSPFSQNHYMANPPLPLVR